MGVTDDTERSTGYDYQSPNPAAPNTAPSGPKPNGGPPGSGGAPEPYQDSQGNDWYWVQVGWKTGPDPAGGTDGYGNPKTIQIPVYDWKTGAQLGVDKKAGTDKTGGSTAQPRNDALTAAMDNLKSYLAASAQADARRQASFDAFQKLSDWALPAGSKTSPADAPGGPGQAFAASIGLKNFNPVPIQTQMVDPSALAQPAPVDPVVQQMLAGVSAAG